VAISARVSILLILATACNFPRPPDLVDAPVATGDAATGCQHDEDCSGGTPVCIDNACAVCRTSVTCPTSSPVCDEASHGCRLCAKDSECDSGACDLAAGTCVGQGAILYASPNGGNADPCIRTAPCSFLRAGQLVDVMHQYIVLLPGIHSSAPLFDGKAATVCGGDATVDLDTGRIGLSHGASITIRNLKMSPSSDPAPNGGVTPQGAGTAILYDNSDLTLDNLELSPGFLDAIQGDGTITIRNSKFISATLVLGGRSTVDRSLFLSGGIAIFGDGSSGEVTNSIFVADSANRIAIEINSSTDSTSPGLGAITNNTFIGGTTSCGGGALYEKVFEFNIFYNTGSLQAPPGCTYRYNLVTPLMDIGGTGNFSGDPLFVDAANNDFHLQQGSPAIDAALSPTQPNGHDHDGVLRPQGIRSDIGAFEYVPAP